MSTFQAISDAARERVALADTLGLLWYVLPADQAEDMAKKAMAAPATASSIRSLREVLETVNRSIVEAFIRGDSLEPSIAYVVPDESLPEPLSEPDFTSVGEALVCSVSFLRAKKDILRIMQDPANKAWLGYYVDNSDAMIDRICNTRSANILNTHLKDALAHISTVIHHTSGSNWDLGRAIHEKLADVQRSLMA
jgi:hypothetical protein